tara:strand:- start:230 stop:1144 length:915 start_codon:yes stop_codon:yes gene_type:complete
MLSGGFLLATVMLWFISNNNDRFVQAKAKLQAKAAQGHVPRILQLADFAMAIPLHPPMDPPVAPAIPARLVRRHGAVSSAFERSQAFRSLIRGLGYKASPIQICEQADPKSCQEMVLVTIEGRPTLFRVIDGRRLSVSGKNVSIKDLEAQGMVIRRWPANAPGIFAGLEARLGRWPVVFDNPDRLLAWITSLAFLFAIITLRLFGREEKQDATGYHPSDSEGEFGFGPVPEPEESAAHEAELDKAAEEWDLLRRETEHPEPVGDMVAAASEGVEPETKSSEDQLGHLSEGEGHEGDGGNEAPEA